MMVYFINNNGEELYHAVNEAMNPYKNLVDGGVYSCFFPMFRIGHQKRLAISVNSNNVGPLLMATGHIEHGKDDWKKYPENKLIRDWDQEGFRLPSYANTGDGGLYTPEKIKIYSLRGKLTDYDYRSIVKSTIDRINNNLLDNLFECLGYDDFIECLLNDTVNEY